MFDLVEPNEDLEFLIRKKKFEKIKEESELASYQIRQAYKEIGTTFEAIVEFSKNRENWSDEDWALLEKERAKILDDS